MRATLAALASADLDDVDDAALEAEVVELVRLQQQLSAQVSRRVARWDASKVWRRDGSRSAAARLARDTGTSPATARSIVKRGRAMGSQPAASDAWTCGQLSGDHFGILLRARGAGRAELYDRDEAFLVEHCRRLRFAQANLFIRAWIVRADAELNPDGTPPPVNHLAADATFDGALAVNGMLEPVGGAIVAEALARIERELELADRKAGRERSMGERRAAALVEMARRAMAAPAGARRPEPLICVVVGPGTAEYLCRTLAGHELDPGVLIPHLTDA